MQIKVYGEVFECASFDKTADSLTLYDANGTAVTTFSGISSWDGYDFSAVPAATMTAAANKARIAELEAYLTSTDWQVTRLAETGVALKTGVTEARAAARAEISKLRGDAS